MAAVRTVTRFAPSPTGRLHVGNIRTALVCWLAARAAGGAFMLRLDDTDAERSREEHVEAIRADLAWLGLLPDGEVRQSARGALYQEAFETLHASGRVYPCYESEEELAVKRRVALGRGLPPVYDRAALRLSADERRALEGGGVRPHWRFRLEESAIGWRDLVRGEQRFEAANLSDPVVRRADGSWLYLLPSVIDDIDMRVSHVVRGEDHVANTAVQWQMFEALGAPPPAFAHLALLTAADGKLSKREGAVGVEAIRDGGIEAVALLALLARLGTRDPVVAVARAEDLIANFSFDAWARAPARFDPAELARVNGTTLHLLPFSAVTERLPAGMDEPGWLAIRPNIERLLEAADWWRVVTDDPVPPALDEAEHAYVVHAAEVAATVEWGDTPWLALTAALKAETGRKGRALYLPLRRALTGREHGPDMAALLPLIGRERTLRRLAAV
ncbi:glutamate--tRNA ligase [Sphingomonas sp.]|uniref:glutamate--tRNA ligase n=1 Tax=Sphingomonas sp. TaxID=28214 RepID=UPI003AFFBAA1